MVRRILYKYADIIEKYPARFMVSMIILSLILFYWIAPQMVLYISIKGLLTFLTSSTVTLLLKRIFKVARGEIKSINDYRFPSFHTSVASSLVVVTFTIPYIGIIFSILIPLTGWARIIVGKHKLHEVIVGAIVGIVIGLIILEVI